MKTYNSLQELSTLELRTAPKKKINIVTDSELKSYESHIKRKSNRFIQKYLGRAKGSRTEEIAITNVGMSVLDIEQELLIMTWRVLREYDPTKSFGPNGFCPKRNFILHCLDNRLKVLSTRIHASKRGFKCEHDFDSIVITGEFSEMDS